MMRVVFDTNIWISRQPKELPSNMLMSVVVLQELMAGAIDKANLQRWDSSCKAHEKEGTLLVPNSEDWREAGKILNALLRGLKSRSKGLTPKLHPDDKQRIIRDVLIARTAKRADAVVITDNVKDFERIKRFCRVKIISSNEYFG